MRYENLKEEVNVANKQLLSIGFSWTMIDDFWKECINESKERLTKTKKF